jgi:hypothetical protein
MKMTEIESFKILKGSANKNEMLKILKYIIIRIVFLIFLFEIKQKN